MKLQESVVSYLTHKNTFDPKFQLKINLQYLSDVTGMLQ